MLSFESKTPIASLPSTLRPRWHLAEDVLSTSFVWLSSILQHKKVRTLLVETADPRQVSGPQSPSLVISSAKQRLIGFHTAALIKGDWQKRFGQSPDTDHLVFRSRSLVREGSARFQLYPKCGRGYFRLRQGAEGGAYPLRHVTTERRGMSRK